MSAADEILKQRRAELAKKFLTRSREEALRCRARLAAASVGAPLPQAADLKMLAHKISGTGATLGLDSLSDRARNFEQELARHADGEALSATDLEALRASASELLEDIERRSAAAL